MDLHPACSAGHNAGFLMQATTNFTEIRVHEDSLMLIKLEV